MAHIWTRSHALQIMKIINYLSFTKCFYCGRLVLTIILDYHKSKQKDMVATNQIIQTGMFKKGNKAVTKEYKCSLKNEMVALCPYDLSYEGEEGTAVDIRMF